jgi:hypothetical protein
MHPWRILVVTFTVLALAGAAAHAGCDLDEDDLEDLIGYEITGVKQVSGWVDRDDGAVGDEDDWEGCDYGRKVIFDDGDHLICKEHTYDNAYGEQTAIIFADGSRYRVCINDELIDFARY